MTSLQDIVVAWLYCRTFWKFVCSKVAHKWTTFQILVSRVYEPSPLDTKCEHLALKKAIDCASTRSNVAYILSAHSRTVKMWKQVY